MAFVVVYDANVLYPNTLRDLLLRLHQADLVQAKWTDEILDEVFRALARNRPDIPGAKLTVLRARMLSAVRDWKVSGYERLVDVLELPDPADRHVLAAAIRCRAQVIVTNNTKHFPSSALGEWDIEAKSADDFVLDQISLNRQAVYAEVVRIADSRTRPPQAPDDVLRDLERSGLVESVAALSAGF